MGILERFDIDVQTMVMRKLAESITTKPELQDFVKDTAGLTEVDPSEVTVERPTRADIGPYNAAAVKYNGGLGTGIRIQSKGEAGTSLETPISQVTRFATEIAPEIAEGSKIGLTNIRNALLASGRTAHLAKDVKDANMTMLKAYLTGRDSGAVPTGEVLEYMDKNLLPRLKEIKEESAGAHEANAGVASRGIGQLRDNVKKVMDDYYMDWNGKTVPLNLRYNDRHTSPTTLFHELSHIKRMQNPDFLSSRDEQPNKFTGAADDVTGLGRLVEESRANADALKNTAMYSPGNAFNPRTYSTLWQSEMSYLNDFLSPLTGGRELIPGEWGESDD